MALPINCLKKLVLLMSSSWNSKQLIGLRGPKIEFKMLDVGVNISWSLFFLLPQKMFAYEQRRLFNTLWLKLTNSENNIRPNYHSLSNHVYTFITCDFIRNLDYLVKFQEFCFIINHRIDLRQISHLFLCCFPTDTPWKLRNLWFILTKHVRKRQNIVSAAMHSDVHEEY